MTLSRKTFIRQMSLIAATPTLAGFTKTGTVDDIRRASLDLGSDDPLANAADEDYWQTVQKAYNQSEDFVNLENGYYLPSPTVVTEALNEKTREINSLTSFYMRRRMVDERFAVRKKVAEYSGVPVEELLIMRNTTEALDTVILGLDIKPGDEILLATTEYPNMVASWDMRARRFGITLKKNSSATYGRQ